MVKLGERLMHSWNAFTKREDENTSFDYGGVASSYRPDRPRFTVTNERSIVASTIMRIGIDAAAVNMWHVRLDEDMRFLEIIESGLNQCLTVEANLDQGARHFRQDAVMSLCDQGVIAIVPVETSISPLSSGGYDIRNLRVGEIVQWYPSKIRVRVYNEKTGQKEELTLPKSIVAIVENPLYKVMNEPNSTLQRLTRKLSLLDAIDDQSGSGKLDIIIQLPYVVKTDARRQQAEQRREMIESQLKGSKYGIAYTDGTEKVTQLNRPAENNMLEQVDYLTEMLYGQLGITKEVMNGTADEATMINYYNRTIEPLLGALSEAMIRTFLTKTARSQRQSIIYLRDPFKLVPVKDIAEIGDKLTRNEVLTSNELRGIIGFRPSKEPDADKLRNKNLPEPEPTETQPTQPESQPQLPNEDPTGSRVKQIMEG